MADLYRTITQLLICVVLRCTHIQTTILYSTATHDTILTSDLVATDFALYGVSGIKMFGTTYNKCDLDKKGGLETTHPDALVSIYMWLDSELNFVNHPTGRLKTKVITSDTNGELTTAASDVAAAFGSGFTPTQLAIFTYSEYTADGTSDPPTITFQLVLITDGTETYLEFNYPTDSMGWWEDSSGNYPKIKVQYNGADVIELAGSGTSQVETYIPQGNVPGTGYEGRWMYKIDGTCATCSSSNGGYVKECSGGDTTKCVCSSCDAGAIISSSSTSGLTEEEKNIIIATTTLGILGIIGMGIGLGLYFKKKKG